jgi:hypothetical protein
MRNETGRAQLYRQTFRTSSVSSPLQQKDGMAPLYGTGWSVSKQDQKNRGRGTKLTPNGDGLVEISDQNLDWLAVIAAG